jgi:UDP-N-acetylglucosamine--dolichyl-phosphate N-acetylglucosaminephosphotransferase
MLDILLIAFVASFGATWLVSKVLLRKINFTSKVKKGSDVVLKAVDRNKARLPLVGRMGGLAILFGFSFALLISLGLLRLNDAVTILAALTTVLLIGLLGLMDDLFKMRQIWRVILPGIAALPLVIISVGTTSLYVPFFGNINFGIYYSFLLVPIGVIAVANLINMLAGFNGLEAGTGVITNGAVAVAGAYLAWTYPQSFAITAPLIAISMVGACMAFLKYNWFPAKLFVENVGTYAIATALVAAVIIGNIERVGVIVLIPQIAEFFLKARSGFKAQNWGPIDRQGNRKFFGNPRNGRLDYTGPIYSVSHIFQKYWHPTEKQLVIWLLALQAFFGLLAISSIFW